MIGRVARLWPAAAAVAAVAAVSGAVGGVLLAAASFALWRSVLLLAAQGDHRTTVLLALALAAAPLISPAVLYFYPSLLLLAPLLSPWGFAPRRVVGFMIALVAPLALAVAAGLFLAWLFAMPGLSAPAPNLSLQADRFAPLLAAPGALAALAGAGRGRRTGAIFLAGTAGGLALGAGLAAVAGAHFAWATTSRRPLLLAAAGIVVAGLLLAAERAPDAAAELAGRLLLIARGAASP